MVACRIFCSWRGLGLADLDCGGYFMVMDLGTSLSIHPLPFDPRTPSVTT